MKNYALLALIIVSAGSHVFATHTIRDEYQAYLEREDTPYKKSLTFANDFVMSQYKMLQAYKYWQEHYEAGWAMEATRYNALVQLRNCFFVSHETMVIQKGDIPSLDKIIDELTHLSKLKRPLVIIVRHPQPQGPLAFSFGSDVEGILLSESSIMGISDKMLRGVIAHEYGHLHHKHLHKRLGLEHPQQLAFAEKMYTIATCIFGASAFLSSFCGRRGSYKEKLMCGVLIGGSVTTFIGLLFALIYFYQSKGWTASLLAKMFQKQEYEADAFALDIEPEGLKAFLLLTADKYSALGEHDYITLEKDLDVSDELRSRIIKENEQHKAWYKTFLQELLEGSSATHPKVEDRIARIDAYLAKKKQEESVDTQL